MNLERYLELLGHFDCSEETILSSVLIILDAYDQEWQAYLEISDEN